MTATRCGGIHTTLLILIPWVGATWKWYMQIRKEISGSAREMDWTNSIQRPAIFIKKDGLSKVTQLVFGNWNTKALQAPEYSPLFGEFKGMPPALFTVGAADPLLDDSYFMETRWRNAGNKTFLAVYPECSHGFNVIPAKIAKLANAKMYSWINDLCN